MNGSTRSPLSRPGARRTHNPVNSRGTPSGERRPRGALPQPGPGLRSWVHSVGGSRRSRSLRGPGETPMEHRPPMNVTLTGAKAPGHGQVGGLAGAARPRKDIGGAQRSAQAGQNSAAECKGKSRPDWAPQSEEPRGESLA